jgi:hypothetical protein
MDFLYGITIVTTRKKGRGVVGVAKFMQQLCLIKPGTE